MFYPLKLAQECRNAPPVGSILGPTALASRGIQAAPRYPGVENTYHPLNLLSLPKNPRLHPHPWFPYPSLLHWMNSLVFLEARQDLRTPETRLDLEILVLAALLDPRDPSPPPQCSISWPTTLEEDFQFTRGQEGLRDPKSPKPQKGHPISLKTY